MNRRHAAVVIALWAGFYVVGAGLVLLLLAVPYAQVALGGGGLGFSGLACAAAAVYVAWALVPRGDAPPPPGIAVDRSESPELAALVDRVARGAGHPPLDQVYVVPGMNAFAGVRRVGLFRSERYAGIGLPLFEVLDAEALASVVAHELGHHVAGDTSIGPFVYRTRRALARALDHLEGSSFWLHLPFVLYARLFLAASRPSARAQELGADRLAAKLCGVDATARALTRIEDAAPAWDTYFHLEVLPLLERGWLPPLIEGFRLFRANPAVRAELTQGMADARARPPRPHDTHPTLEERLRALGRAADGPAVPRESALALVSNLGVAERRAALGIMKDPSAARLASVGWDTVAARAWLPVWRAELTPFARVLGGLTLPGVADVLARPEVWAPRFRLGIGTLSPEAERRRLTRVISAFVLVWLSDEGFALHLVPGSDVRAELADLSFEPEADLRRLADGSLGAPDWKARCAEVERVVRRARPGPPPRTPTPGHLLP